MEIKESDADDEVSPVHVFTLLAGISDIDPESSITVIDDNEEALRGEL